MTRQYPRGTGQAHAIRDISTALVLANRPLSPTEIAHRAGVSTPAADAVLRCCCVPEGYAVKSEAGWIWTGPPMTVTQEALIVLRRHGGEMTTAEILDAMTTTSSRQSLLQRLNELVDLGYVACVHHYPAVWRAYARRSEGQAVRARR